MVSSIGFLLFYWGGGSVGDTVTVPFVSIQFSNVGVLGWFSWAGLFWFAYRYWLMHKGAFMHKLRQETNNICVRTVFRPYLEQMLNARIIDKAKENLGWIAEHVYWNGLSMSIECKFVGQHNAPNYDGVLDRSKPSAQRHENHRVVFDDWRGRALVWRQLIPIFVTRSGFSDHAVPVLMFALVLFTAAVDCALWVFCW